MIACIWYPCVMRTKTEWSPSMGSTTVNTTSGDERLVTTAEPDLAELHALFESECEQFLNDTSDEIAKLSQKFRNSHKPLPE
jgi:hypothetical protein